MLENYGASLDLPHTYYRHYICQFADVAAPLNHLTNKGVPFIWDNNCQVAFEALKKCLTQSPILAYPNFTTSASQFQLHTDASAIGLGAVLEQCGKVVAYASRTLTLAERNYSVIQCECLAIIYALKQFHHYLLGRHYASHRSRPTPVASRSKDGRPIGALGPGCTGI